MSFKVTSYGDFVDINELQEELEVHSVFKDVINLKTHSTLVSIVTSTIGNGPNNIVMDTDYFLKCRNLLSSSYPLFSKRLDMDFRTAQKYKSELFITTIENEVLLKNLNISTKIVLGESSPLSSAFLLEKSREKYFVTELQKSIMERLRSGFNNILEGSLTSIEEIKGVGFGLTPQGYDLIDGLVIALYLFEQINGKSTKELRKRIYNSVLNGSLLSINFIYYSSIGCFYEHFRNYIMSIVSNTGKVEETTRRILTFGETSGADILSGFILSIKKLIEGGVLWQ